MSCSLILLFLKRLAKTSYRRSLVKMTSGHFREIAHSAGNFIIRAYPLKKYSRYNDRWSFPRVSDDIS